MSAAFTSAPASIPCPTSAPDGRADGFLAKAAERALARFSRVLVLDDDDVLRRSVARFLRAARLQVSEAKSVAEGIDLLARDPQLVLTDVRLPDGNGRRLVELASQRRPAPLVIAMSGSASAREAFALAQCGARIYITKPFTQRELVDHLVELCSGSPVAQREPVLDGNLGRCLVSFARRYAIPDREMALVRLATAGVSRARCPELLGVTENTCKTLTRRLLQRCGARSLAQIPRLVLMGETLADAH